MHGVGGIADEGEADVDRPLGVLQRQRIGERGLDGEGAEEVAEAAAELVAKNCASEPAMIKGASSARSVQTIDERSPGCSGRMANGPAGRKCSWAMKPCGRWWRTVQTIAVCP